MRKGVEEDPIDDHACENAGEEARREVCGEIQSRTGKAMLVDEIACDYSLEGHQLRDNEMALKVPLSELEIDVMGQHAGRGGQQWGLGRECVP